jgi:hypothetical protein
VGKHVEKFVHNPPQGFIVGVPLMPRGPQGQKRPADVIGTAVMVAKIATGEIEEDIDLRSAGKVRSGKAGGKARASKLSPDERSRIAAEAAKKRWQR